MSARDDPGWTQVALLPFCSAFSKHEGLAAKGPRTRQASAHATAEIGDPTQTPDVLGEELQQKGLEGDLICSNPENQQQQCTCEEGDKCISEVWKQGGQQDSTEFGRTISPSTQSNHSGADKRKGGGIVSLKTLKWTKQANRRKELTSAATADGRRCLTAEAAFARKKGQAAGEDLDGAKEDPNPKSLVEMLVPRHRPHRFVEKKTP
eukprot:g7045.t1